MAEILIVGKGGFGDWFPLLAIGQALRQRGHQVRVAAEAHHASACAQAGLEFHVVGSDASSSSPSPGESGSAWAAARGVLQATLSPQGLAAEVRALRPLAESADLMLGNQLAYAGALVRRLLHKPWVFCAASPLAIPSRLDAPLWPYLQTLQQLAARLGLPQSGFVDLARLGTRLLMRPQAALRRELGLPAAGHPRFEAMYSEQLNLLPVSPLLAPPQADWPAHTRVLGYTWFEADFLGDEAQARTLREFAQAGPAPVVFALGGSLRVRPGDFYERAVQACRRLGRRAILVAGRQLHAGLPTGEDVELSGYLPYSKAFGLGAAVVHSGGIGAIGWGLRAGVPQLLVPAEWDQFDNARRAQRAGVAQVLARRDWQVPDLARALGEVLEDQALRWRCAQAAAGLRAEDGAGAACEAIEQLLAPR
jgi:UDP:flavonoid glycosyltransferase YjiC (YdhE family)